MEALPQPQEAPPERRLPSGRNKVGRISEQTKGLFDDFTSWVELRLKLFQADIQEKVEKKVDAIVIKVAPLVSAAIAGFFGLLTLALFLGWWLGHPAWGFLCVTLLFVLATGALVVRKNRLEKKTEQEASWRRHSEHAGVDANGEAPAA